jgi:hypothetical protein
MSFSRVLPLRIATTMVLLCSQLAIAGNPYLPPRLFGRPPIPTPPINIPPRQPYVAPRPPVLPRPQLSPPRSPVLPRPQQPRPSSPWGFFPGDV